MRKLQRIVFSSVGESGSGKSTLAALLQNLYPVQKGQIFIGVVGIKHIHLASLRSLVGVVPQRVDLFEGSVLDNIILDDYEPDMKKVLTICKEVDVRFWKSQTELI